MHLNFSLDYGKFFSLNIDGDSAYNSLKPRNFTFCEGNSRQMMIGGICRLCISIMQRIFSCDNLFLFLAYYGLVLCLLWDKHSNNCASCYPIPFSFLEIDSSLNLSSLIVMLHRTTTLRKLSRCETC